MELELEKSSSSLSESELVRHVTTELAHILWSCVHLVDNEVEVFPLQDSESEATDHISEDENIDQRTWGNQRKIFYNGNQLSDGSSSDIDHLEQEEVNNTQKRIYSTLKEYDFEPPWIELDQIVKSSLGVSVSTVEEIPVLEKILQSFQQCITWLRRYGMHSVQLISEISPFTREGNSYIQSKVHLMFCYCVNVLYYLQLITNQQLASSHPVLGQMMMLTKLKSQVKNVDDQLALLPTKHTDKVSSVSVQSTPCSLQYYQEMKKSQAQMHGINVEGKRAITYQMARNKGLMPKRKKEQRNPRVKHRNKYNRALIKRKSQVLPVVHELYKYGGEASGIRHHLARSISIK